MTRDPPRVRPHHEEHIIKDPLRVRPHLGSHQQIEFDDLGRLNLGKTLTFDLNRRVREIGQVIDCLKLLEYRREIVSRKSQRTLMLRTLSKGSQVAGK